MSTVAKMVSFLVIRSATTHRQSQSLLEEIKSAYHDKPLHCSVRLLSRNKVLLGLVECLVKIRVFLVGQGKAYPKLEDEKWLIKLISFADITHLNKFNLHPLNTGLRVMCHFDVWKGFVSKLGIFM